jgi:acyl carrier protein
MNDALRSSCAAIFREVSGLQDSETHFGWSDEKLLNESLEALEVDSLTLLEFVMRVENDYDVELNEDEVNRCKNVADLVALVAAARDGPS